MNNTTLEKKGIVSPFMKKPSDVIDVRDENHPVREEVRKLCNTSYLIKVTFEEDKDTARVFSHIPGLIAILCKFSIGNEVIAYGRSFSVFSKLNKYIARTISGTLNGSFLSASNNAVKMLESFRINESNSGADKPIVYEEEDLATEKQKGYLASLIEERIPFKERPQWIKGLSDNLLTRMEASEKINDLLNNY